MNGLCPYGDKLYAFVLEMWNLALAQKPGMSVHDGAKISYRNDLWESSDGTSWKLIRKGIPDCRRMTEGPRLTNQGRLLAYVTAQHFRPAVALWPSDNPTEIPEIVEMPYRHAHPEKYYGDYD